MPATLGHIGVQYLATKGLMPKADPKWILLGCIIPDLPWIVQRIAIATTDVPVIAMRLYAISQSSLGISLFLCAFFAQFSRQKTLVFSILAFGVFLHLLLDATQIKWGNGVVLFAPFHWNTVRFDLFWPEDPVTLILLALGLFVAIWLVIRSPHDSDDLVSPCGASLAMLLLCLAAYFIIPALTMSAVEKADLHYTGTISDNNARAGRAIEIDRNAIRLEDGRVVLQTWFGEEIALTGETPPGPARISLIGRFTDQSTIDVTRYHVHLAGLRDNASMFGLGFVLFWWLRVFWRLRPL